MDDPGPLRILAAGEQVPQQRPPASGRGGPGAAWTTRPAGFSITASHSSAWTMRGSRLTLDAGPGRCGPLPGRAQRREHQPQRPQGDRHVGEVEGRPQREVDEIGHGVGAHPVGEVAERAAGQQADGEPQARPPRDRARTRRAPAPGRRSSPRARIPAPRRSRTPARGLVVLVRSKPSTRLSRWPTASEETTIALVTWSTRTTAPQTASARRQAAIASLTCGELNRESARPPRSARSAAG